MPEFSCEDPTGCIDHTLRCELSNNVLWDQQVQTWYNTDVNEANPKKFYLRMNIVNNYSVARTTYGGPMFLNSFLDVPQNELFVAGNMMNLYDGLYDFDLFYCCDDFSAPENHPNTSVGVANQLEQRNSFPAITYTPTTELQAYISQYVGAFPRFAHEQRLMHALEQNSIDLTPMGEAVADDVLELPFTSMPQPPTDTDNDGMPNSWEASVGLNPQQADHNGTQLSLNIMGVEGYTNLECYLHCLSEMYIRGEQTPGCGWITAVETELPSSQTPMMFPSPATNRVTIKLPEHTGAEWTVVVYDLTGVVRFTAVTKTSEIEISLGDYAQGMYTVRVMQTGNKTSHAMPLVHLAE